MNFPERITYRRLSEVCARRAALVNVKVRLADVLPIEGSGLSQDLYQFALQAHYDFVITDLAQHPLFAVEFDGPSHDYPTQLLRDDKKDEMGRRIGGGDWTRGIRLELAPAIHGLTWDFSVSPLYDGRVPEDTGQGLLVVPRMFTNAICRSPWPGSAATRG